MHTRTHVHTHACIHAHTFNHNFSHEHNTQKGKKRLILVTNMIKCRIVLFSLSRSLNWMLVIKRFAFEINV